MRKLAVFMVLQFAILTILGVAAPRPAAASAAEPEFSGQLATAHFRFHHHAAERVTVEELAAYLEGHYGRVAGDLRPGDMPVISVWVYSSRDEFIAATQRLALVPENTACAGSYEIHMISPAAAGNDPQELRQSAVHALTHCMVRHLVNQAPIPRWLSESIAQYESKMWVDPRYLDYAVAGDFPSLAEMNDPGSNRVYQMGYTLIDFVVTSWGIDAVRQLLVDLGDVPGALGVTEEQFCRSWKDFVFGKYLTACTCF